MSIGDFEEFKHTLTTRLRYQEVGRVRFWLSPVITDDLDAYLDQLCARYLAGTGPERRELRELFKDPEAHWYLHDYIPRATARIKPPQAKEHLLSGLTAVALTEAGCDYRDTQYELGYLFRAAQNAGIHDPMPEFLQIAQTLESKDDRSVGWLMAHVKESGAYHELRVFS